MAEKNQKEEIDELEEDDFGDFEQAEGGESISKVEVINGISNQEQYINQANPSEKKENFNEAQLINLALTKNTTIENNIVVQEKVIENFEENIGRNFLNLEENILSSNSEKLDSENLEEQKNLHIQDKEEINENPNSNYQPNDYEKGNIKTQEIKEQELNLEKKSDNIENDNVLGLYHNNMKFVEKEIAEINQDERKIHQTAESKINEFTACQDDLISKSEKHEKVKNNPETEEKVKDKINYSPTNSFQEKQFEEDKNKSVDLKHLINDDFKEEHVNAFPVLSSQEDINENFKAKEEYDQNNLKTNLEENERNFENKNSGTLKNLEGVNQNILIIEQENTNEMQSRDFINSFKQDLQLNKILEEDAFEDIETNKETEIKIEVQQNQNFSEKKDEFLEISNPEKSPLSHQILIKTEIENSFKEEEKYPVGEINKLNGQDLDNKVNPKYFMENQQLEKDFEKLNFQREDIPEIKNNNDENLSSKHLEDFLNYQKPLSDQKILLQEDVIIKVENPSKEEDDKKLIEQETPKKEINEEEKENIENEEDEDEFGEFNYNVIEIKDDQEIQNTKEEKRFDQTEEEFNNFQNPEKKLCDKEHDKHNDINFANFTQNEEIIPKPSDIQNFDINFAQITQKEEFDKITFQSDKKEIIEADKDLIKNQEKENEEEFEEFIEFNANDIDKKETINFNDKQQFHKEEEEKYHEFNCNNDIKDDFVQLPQEKIEEGKEDDLNDDFGEFNENINKEDENQKSTKDQENKASNQFFDLFKSANTQNEVNTLNFATNFSGNFSSNFSNINFFQQSQNQNIESQINAENDQNQIEFQKKENIDDLFGENEEKINLEEKNPIFDEEISQKQTDEDNYNDNLSIQKKKDFSLLGESHDLNDIVQKISLSFIEFSNKIQFSPNILTEKIKDDEQFLKLTNEITTKKSVFEKTVLTADSENLLGSLINKNISKFLDDRKHAVNNYKEILEKKLNSDLISDIKQLNLIWKGSSLKSGLLEKLDIKEEAFDDEHADPENEHQKSQNKIQKQSKISFNYDKKDKKNQLELSSPLIQNSLLQELNRSKKKATEIPKLTSLKSEELKGNEIKITKEKIIESIPENLNSVHVNDNENKKNLANINNNNKPIIDLKITTKNDFNIVKKEDLQKTIEKENEKIEEFFKNLPNYEFLFSEKILLKNKQKI